MLANPKRTKNEIVQWIREYFAANGNDCCAVIGISGGKDSSVVAALCVEALGAERVIGVLMPNGRQKDIADSKLLVDTLGIASITVDIGGAYSKMVDVVGRAMPSGVSNQAAVNLPPRLRMATLYMVAQSLARGGRVANTCNRSEDYVGYSTKFGDSAGDFSPLANIMVHEVRQIGYELPIPRELVDKTPSDGLCGKTDEDNLGFTYMQLDNYIMHGSNGIRRFVRFHRLVMHAKPGQCVDHINKNKADNRKKNLRCCERSENDRNRSLYSCNTSGVAGVYFDKERKKWVASITYNHKKVYLGRYAVKEEAILARLTKEVELYKEFSPQRGLLESLNL